MLNPSHPSFPELFTLQFITNRAWLQNLSNPSHKGTFFKLSPQAVLPLSYLPWTLLHIYIMYIRTFLVILPAQQMSVHNNLDAGTACLQQADATVFSRRGSYFYFSMRAVKASQNKQTQVKLLFFFFFAVPCPLLSGRTALLLFTAGSPHGEMQRQRTAAFWWSTHVYMKSIP